MFVSHEYISVCSSLVVHTVCDNTIKMNKREVCNLGTVHTVRFVEFYYVNQPVHKELTLIHFYSVSGHNTSRRHL